MRFYLLLGVLVVTALGSDIARQYATGKEPGLVSGTAASNAAGAGVPQPAGQELATSVNKDKGHDYKDDRTR